MTNRVDVYVKAEGTASEAEDENVPGVYLVNVDATLDPSLRASAALDCFHEHWGVACLDDFTFTAYDSEGRELAEPEGQDSYKLGSRASFCGKIEDEDHPIPSAPSIS